MLKLKLYNIGTFELPVLVSFAGSGNYGVSIRPAGDEDKNQPLAGLPLLVPSSNFFGFLLPLQATVLQKANHRDVQIQQVSSTKTKPQMIQGYDQSCPGNNTHDCQSTTSSVVYT